jgi:hypothetical protein
MEAKYLPCTAAKQTMKTEEPSFGALWQCAPCAAQCRLIVVSVCLPLRPFKAHLPLAAVCIMQLSIRGGHLPQQPLEHRLRLALSFLIADRMPASCRRRRGRFSKYRRIGDVCDRISLRGALVDTGPRQSNT